MRQFFLQLSESTSVMMLQSILLLFLCLHFAVATSENAQGTKNDTLPFVVKKVKCMRLTDTLNAFSVTYETDQQHSAVWFEYVIPVYENKSGHGSFWTTNRNQGNHYNSTLFITMKEDDFSFTPLSLHLFNDYITLVLEMNTTGIYDYEQNIYDMKYTPSEVEDRGRNISFSVPSLVVQTDKEDGGSFETAEVFTIDGFATTTEMRKNMVAMTADDIHDFRFSEEKSNEKLIVVTVRKPYDSSPLRGIRVEKEVGQPYVYPKETFSFNQYYTKSVLYPFGDNPYRLSRCSTIGSYKLKSIAEPEPGSYFRTISLFKGHRRDIFAVEGNFTRDINFSCVAYQEGTEKWPDMTIEATLDLMKKTP